MKDAECWLWGLRVEKENIVSEEKKNFWPDASEKKHLFKNESTIKCYFECIYLPREELSMA